MGTPETPIRLFRDRFTVVCAVDTHVRKLHHVFAQLALREALSQASSQADVVVSLGETGLIRT